jgi:hypothetical protein
MRARFSVAENKGWNMKTAILGWGSLLWEGGSEFDKIHESWQSDGPTLNLEFSRASDSRLGALTLVIDNAHGTPTRVAWCISKRRTLEDALCDLRSREGTTLDKIGRVTVTAEMAGADARVPDEEIIAWARAKHLEAVIWTALSSNFQEKTKQPFSIDAALSYLKKLTPAGKAKAAEYIWRAPDFVKTSLRSAVQREPTRRSCTAEASPKHSAENLVQTLLCRTYGAPHLYSTFTQGFRTWARLFRLLRRLGPSCGV